MLITAGRAGGLRSRPLSIAEKRSDGTLYFATSIDSEKVLVIRARFQRQRCVAGRPSIRSLTGQARIVRDRALIHELWSESWKVWFPEGETDSSLCLLAVEPTEASYWDAAAPRV